MSTETEDETLTKENNFGATITKNGWSARRAVGYAGEGWYVWLTEYPEEGADFFESEEDLRRFMDEEGSRISE